jgi:ribosomal subunit interface protein
MKTIISATNFDLTDALRDHVEESVKKLDKFKRLLDGPVEITMKVEKNEFFAECKAHMKHHPIVSHEKTDDMYTSINKAIKESARQIRQQKEIITKHHHPKVDVA